MAKTKETNRWMAVFAAIFVVAMLAMSLPALAYANEGEVDAGPILQADNVEHDDAQFGSEAGFESLILEVEDVSSLDDVDVDMAGDGIDVISENGSDDGEASSVVVDEVEVEVEDEAEVEKDEQSKNVEEVEEAFVALPESTLALATTSDSESPAVSVPLERDYDPVAVISTGEGAETVRKKTVGKIDYLFLPSYANAKQLAISWSDQFLDQLVYASAIRNGTYSNEVFDATKCAADENEAFIAYVRASEKGQIRVLRIMQSEGVRTLYLKSDDPENKGRAYVEASQDHSAKATGAMTLVTSAGKAVVQDAQLTQIKGRGNSTWGLDKKPYQIKLAEKASLLDGLASNKAKTWLLLANRCDQTQLRNYVALRTALAAGLAATPDCEFVDLYYDGEYRGLYLLTEKVEIGSGRVDIAEIKNESSTGDDLDDLPIGVDINTYGYEFHYVSDAEQSATSNIKGGYLLELDNANYSKERCYFKTSAGYFVLKSPENATYEQMKYISEYVQAAVAAASSASGNAAKYFDLDSLARFFLVNELAKNSDYMRYSSTFFYKDADSDVLRAGPVWDFDLAFGVHTYEGFAEYIDVAGITDPNSTFFAGNKQFAAAVKRVLDSGFLTTAKAWTKTGSSSLRGVAARLSQALDLDNLIWGATPSSVAVVRFDTRDESVGYLNDWLSQRIAWMESGLVASLGTLNARPDAVPGSTAAVTRISGETALDTMSEIVKEGGFLSKFAILVTSDGYWDALTASGIAGLVDAPIIMTPTSYLAEQARAQLAKLRPATVIVCGGTMAIASSVAKAASAAAGGARIERCWGEDAVGTAINIFERAPSITGGRWATVAFVCTNDGYWDALSAAPVSYVMHMPIFLTYGSSSISGETLAAMKRGGIKAVYIVGGTLAISEKVENDIRGAGFEMPSRFAGASAIETSEAVATYGINRGMNANLMGVATTNGYWDALSGSAFCGKKRSVIVLVDGPSSHSIKGFMFQNNARVRQAYVFGGDMAVTERTLAAVRKSLSGMLA